MNKKEIRILFSLIGIMLGMIISSFLTYTIDANDLNEILMSSCQKSEVKQINVSFFGKSIKIKCKNGEIHSYNLLYRNYSNKDDNRS